MWLAENVRESESGFIDQDKPKAGDLGFEDIVNDVLVDGQVGFAGVLGRVERDLHADSGLDREDDE